MPVNLIFNKMELLKLGPINRQAPQFLSMEIEHEERGQTTCFSRKECKEMSNKIRLIN